MGTIVTGQQFIADFLAEDADDTGPAQASTTLKFTVKKVILHGLLEKAATVLPTRDIMPVLKNVRIEATPTALRVIASDMELFMIATTSMVTVEQPGIAVFPGKKLLELARWAEAGDATITVTNGDDASITVGRASWTWRLQSGYDYPDIPQITDATYGTVERCDFLAALASVRHAACRDVNRDNLMMIDVTDGQMTASDGSRFQRAPITAFPFNFQIPNGAVDNLVKLLGSTDLPQIAVGDSANHLIFRLGEDTFLVSKLVAAFPNIEATLLRPALANHHTLTVDKAALRAAIKRAQINADTETHAISLTATTGQLTITCRDKWHNACTESVPAEWAGKDHTIVVNHVFLTDMIKTCTAASLTFRLGDDTKTRRAPVLLRDEDTGTIGVVQQMISDWVI
jgi:DNA polymerase-3 subunit beta